VRLHNISRDIRVYAFRNKSVDELLKAVCFAARFLPYATPRLVLDGSFGRKDAEGENIDQMRLGLAVDLGVEVAFQPGWRIGFGGTLGSRSALALGLAFGPMR
jgi:hypothetical protein